MSEFKGTKGEKALAHAKKIWGIYFDDVDEDCNSSRGELSQKDYLAGYNQALEDTQAPQMLEMLKELCENLELQLGRLGCCGHGDGKYHKADNDSYGGASLLNDARELIQQATTI